MSIVSSTICSATPVSLARRSKEPDRGEDVRGRTSSREEPVDLLSGRTRAANLVERRLDQVFGARLVESGEQRERVLGRSADRPLAIDELRIDKRAAN